MYVMLGAAIIYVNTRLLSYFFFFFNLIHILNKYKLSNNILPKARGRTSKNVLRFKICNNRVWSESLT